MSVPRTILAAIATHRAAYDAFQVAPEAGDLSAEVWDDDTEAAIAAEEAYGTASDALVATVCADMHRIPSVYRPLKISDWTSSRRPARNTIATRSALGVTPFRTYGVAPLTWPQ